MLDFPMKEPNRVLGGQVAGSGMPVSYRHARSEDLDAAASLVQQAYNDLRARHGLPPTFPLRPPHFQRFALGEDPSGLWVAESEKGTILGFGFSWTRQGVWFLAQLFVRPDTQSAGIGRVLLTRTLQQADRTEAKNRALITLAYNTASTGLYVRHGIYPREPLYRMSAPADQIQRGGFAREHEVSTIEPWPAPSQWLGRIDEDILGFRRESHHGFQIGSAARSIRIGHHGHSAGYAYISADGHIGPLAVAPSANARIVVEAAIRSALDLGTKQVSMIVPGRAEQILETVSELGFRIEEPMLLMSAQPFGDWRNYLPANPAFM